MTFCEVYGQPMRVGKYNPGAAEEDKQALLQAVASIGTDSAAIIPESMVIEFVESKSVTQNGELYHRAVEYIDNSLSKAVLGQTLTTQMPRQGGGSRAAAQVHDAVRRDILASDARRMALTITNQLVMPMVQLTFGEQKAYPRFWLSVPADQDVKTQSDVLAEMVDHGLWRSDRTTCGYARHSCADSRRSGAEAAYDAARERRPEYEPRENRPPSR